MALFIIMKHFWGCGEGMSRKALLVIDVINDFVKNKEGPLYCPMGESIIENIAMIVDWFHEREQQVIFIQDSHRVNDAEFQLRPVHALKGTWGSELVDRLKSCLNERDYQILKRRHSAFSYTDLDLFLREERIDEVVLVGGMTNVSIRSTASDAFYQAYKVTVISDGCFSRTEDLHQAGLRDIAMFGTVSTFEEFKSVEEFQEK